MLHEPQGVRMNHYLNLWNQDRDSDMDSDETLSWGEETNSDDDEVNNDEDE